MPTRVDLESDPAVQIARIAAEVRRLGNDRTIVNNMAKKIRKSFVPIRRKLRAGADRLPSTAGLDRWVRSSRFRAAVRRSGKSAGVNVVGTRNSKGGRTHLSAIDEGTVRAPFYGNRRAWHTQAVAPGFFSEPMGEHVEAFRADVVEAVNEAAEEVFG